MSVNSPDDILRDVLSGDRDRYEAIVDLYQQQIWRLVASIRLDRETVADITQQTFVDAYLHLDKYRLGTDFSLWLKAIARNLLRRELRDRARRSEHLRQYHREMEHLVAQGEHEEECERRLAAVRDCARRLPESYRDVVERYYRVPQSLEALADGVGGSVGAVRQLLWRARRMLRDCVQKRMAHA